MVVGMGVMALRLVAVVRAAVAVDQGRQTPAEAREQINQGMAALALKRAEAEGPSTSR